MSRVSLLSSPLLLGFEEMERLIDRVGKGSDGYPPYNIERIVSELPQMAALQLLRRCASRWRWRVSGASSSRSRWKTINL